MASTLPVPTVADSKEKISDPMDPVVPSKEYKWWHENIDHVITPSCRKLLEEYSKIPPEDVRAHIYIRYSWKVWAMRQYPCTGMGRFLDNLLAQSPAYKDIVARLRGGESFVDIGCFLGQELRQLVWDFEGAPADQLHAVEIVNHWDLGYFTSGHRGSDNERDKPGWGAEAEGVGGAEGLQVSFVVAFAGDMEGAVGRGGEEDGITMEDRGEVADLGGAGS
ncbi:hypothetical protein EYC84_006513 [Monilinia fructicola]|uniref:Methyltransferase type 11 domain-containing protein n=1 Tax=Monilinia fructicola TaxID=38448 RepID=A0A5M9K8J8_MONFR|nr:hypothetical protein EYC84_006513 [Monilinia fructicola]